MGKAFYSRGLTAVVRHLLRQLYDMNSMPIYQMEALAYHEGIPGHHQQNSIAKRLRASPDSDNLVAIPPRRRMACIPSSSQEMGFYQDPYSDFGRPAMELWRACRLVVDTGIHVKRWTREEAIAYLMTHTPNPERDAVKAIERYIVMPGQATGYKVGMIQILAIRARAMAALGESLTFENFTRWCSPRPGTARPFESIGGRMGRLKSQATPQ